MFNPYHNPYHLSEWDLQRDPALGLPMLVVKGRMIRNMV
jgi:hypothetical protein